MYNDRIDLGVSSQDSLPKPEVKIILNGNSLYKPGMKTYFVEDDSESASIGTGHSENVVTGVYCSCNKVEVSNANLVCSCNPYNSCPSNCSCNAYTATTATTKSNSGGGAWVPCTAPCSCVPVH